MDGDDAAAGSRGGRGCRRRPARCRRGTPAPAGPPTCAATSRRPASRMPERADPPPGLPRVEHLGAHLADAAERRGAEVDRRRAARTRPRPSWRRGTPRWSRPGRAPGCGRARGRGRARGCPAGSRSTSISISSTSAGRQRLHPLDGHPLGELVGDLGAAAGAAWPSSAARRRTSSVSSSSRHGGAHSRSTGSRVRWSATEKRADLVDLVAEELHAQRVLLGRREDVDDAAADGELAALLDQVDAGVRRTGEPAYDVLELDLLARRQLDRLEVGQTLDLRLEHRADRRDHDLERARCSASVPGCLIRRSTARRRPTVSLRGLSRSCGSVSQAG